MPSLDFTAVFRAGPPARDGAYLLGQQFPFVKEHWTRHLPDPAYWPVELDACPSNGTWPVVDRRTVFEIAGRADDGLGAVQTLVAAYVWGTGAKARVAAGLGAVFDANPGLVGQALSTAVRMARGEGPVPAYTVLHREGVHTLHGLGPGIFTKVLYFGAFELGADAPLILDREVTIAVNALRGTDWRPSGPWSPEQYGDYLRYAGDWAGQWAPGTPADMVERTLAAAGKALA